MLVGMGWFIGVRLGRCVDDRLNFGFGVIVCSFLVQLVWLGVIICVLVGYCIMVFSFFLVWLCSYSWVLFFLVRVCVMVRFRLVLLVWCECEVFICMNGLNIVFSCFLVRFGLLLVIIMVIVLLLCLICICVCCVYIIVLFIRLENRWCIVNGCNISIELLLFLKIILLLFLVVFLIMFFSSEFRFSVVCCLVFLVLCVSFRFLCISVCIVVKLLIRCLCRVLLLIFFRCRCSCVSGVCRLWVIVVSICVCLVRCCCRWCCMVLKVLVVCCILCGLCSGNGLCCRLLLRFFVVVVSFCSGVLVMCEMIQVSMVIVSISRVRNYGFMVRMLLCVIVGEFSVSFSSVLLLRVMFIVWYLGGMNVGLCLCGGCWWFGGGGGSSFCSLGMQEWNEVKCMCVCDIGLGWFFSIFISVVLVCFRCVFGCSVCMFGLLIVSRCLCSFGLLFSRLMQFCRWLVMWFRFCCLNFCWCLEVVSMVVLIVVIVMFSSRIMNNCLIIEDRKWCRCFIVVYFRLIDEVSMQFLLCMVLISLFGLLLLFSLLCRWLICRLIV